MALHWLKRSFSLACTVLASTVLSVAALIPACSQAAAQSGADFYKGKTVRLIVGYAPGGGYDAYARFLAPYMEARIGTTVIVENQPGAGGFNALGALLREPGDGLRILMLNGEASVLAQLVDKAGIRFDLRKLAYLGRISFENRTLIAKKGGDLDTLDAFLKSTRVIHFGSGDRIDTMGDPATIFCHALRLKCKLVTGYKGMPDATLAMQRGEVDAVVTAESQVAAYMRSHPIVAVAILGARKAPLLPDVPVLLQHIQLTPEQSRWVRFRADIADFGRTLIVPGDTPAERVNFLQEAVEAVLTDPKVLSEGDRTNRPITYGSAAETRKLVDTTLTSLDAKDREFLKQLLLTGF
jgi:tripartite-type tricarboxylate transporter receptor subunit TctC